MIKATEIRRGMAIRLENTVFAVVDFQHVAKGNWRSYIQLKIRNINTGQLLEERIRSTDTIEEVFIDKKEMEYLYSQGPEHVFMDIESYEQVSLSEDVCGETLKWLKPNTMIQITTCEGKIVSIEPPNTVDLKVVETPPVIKSSTATNQNKDAVLETGVRVKVPPFIENGELIRVDTRTGDYVERVKG
jgi:elongation factor P